MQTGVFAIIAGLHKFSRWLKTSLMAKRRVGADQRADAFVLGTSIITYINAASEQPRQVRRTEHLRDCIQMLCWRLGIKMPAIPRQEGIIDARRAFKKTMSIVKVMQRKIESRFGRSAANPFWLGVTSALPAQFPQNPQLEEKAITPLAEIRRLGGRCGVPPSVINQYLQELAGGDPERISTAFMTFANAVSSLICPDSNRTSRTLCE